MCSLRTARGPSVQHMQFQSVYFLRLSPRYIIAVCDKITSRSLGKSSISWEAQQQETSDNSATCNAIATLVFAHLSPFSWADFKSTAIPRLTSDPDNEFFG